MRYISIFSGIEAASVAWEPLGWEPVCFAEVDEFPSAVLAYRFPDVPNLGDVTKIDWSEVHARYGAVDVLVGGSPCQSFSIAGNREGLKGESGLMFEYIRAIRELLQASGGTSPRYIIWENVPGALSAEKGVAFGQLLAELDELGYGLAWRVLDAQYVRVPDRSADGFFGPVAQRRRRVFLVGVLGSPHAAEILFERESLSWNHPKSSEAREALAERSAIGIGLGGSAGFKYHNSGRTWDVGYEDGNSPTLVADYHQPAVLTLQSDGSSSNGSQNGCGYNEDGSAYTLNGRDRQSVCIQGSMVGREEKNGPHGSGVNDDVSFMKHTSYICFNGGNANDVAYIGDSQKETAPALRATRSGTNGTPVVCIENGKSKAVVTEDVSTALNAEHEQPIIIDRAAFNQGENAKYPPHIEQIDTMDTIVARGPHAVCYRTARA